MNDFAVVICSSDQRLDFLPICLHFLRLALTPQEAERIYVVGATINVCIPGLIACPSISPAEAPWSMRVQEGLKQIPEETILFITEDILFQPADNAGIVSMLCKNFVSARLDALRLDAFPPPVPSSNSLIGEVSVFSLYRVSLQPTLWRRTYLQSLIHERESIWEFELGGSRRSRTNAKIGSLRRNLLPYDEVISRGRLSVKGKHLLEQNGFECSLPVRAKSEEFFIELKRYILKCLASSLIAMRKYTAL